MHVLILKTGDSFHPPINTREVKLDYFEEQVLYKIISLIKLGFLNPLLEEDFAKENITNFEVLSETVIEPSIYVCYQDTVNQNIYYIVTEFTSIDGSEENKNYEYIIKLRKDDLFVVEELIDVTDYLYNYPYVKYVNEDYGFMFVLPNSWNNFSTITETMEVSFVDNHELVEIPCIYIKHPDFPEVDSYQDII